MIYFFIFFIHIFWVKNKIWWSTEGQFSVAVYRTGVDLPPHFPFMNWYRFRNNLYGHVYKAQLTRQPDHPSCSPSRPLEGFVAVKAASQKVRVVKTQGVNRHANKTHHIVFQLYFLIHIYNFICFIQLRAIFFLLPLY